MHIRELICIFGGFVVYWGHKQVTGCVVHSLGGQMEGWILSHVTDEYESLMYPGNPITCGEQIGYATGGIR